MAFLAADILERLRRSHAAGRLPHAMLITGNPGSGRTRLAWEIVAMVNHTTADAAPSHPDVRKLEPESKSRRIIIESFREFCAPFFSTSYRAGAVKVGLIFDADRLHPGAANAFLKTLEEPPANCLFILVTTNPSLLPVTIVSRCAHFPVRSASHPALEGPALEVALATEAVLSAPPTARTGAALGLARRLQSVLRKARADIEAEISAAFKEERKQLGDTVGEEWLKDEEARLKALVEARTVGIRQTLVGVISERAADVLRSRHGVAALRFPGLATESRRLAESLDDAHLLRILDGATRLRLFLDRNVKEDIAIEAGCLALVRP